MVTFGRSRRDIVVDVEIHSDTAGATKAAEGLEKIDKSADKAGRSMGGMSEDARKLQADIDATTRRIAELDEQLIKLGNDRGIRRAIRSEESWLRDMRAMGRRMGLEAGPDIVQGMIDTIVKMRHQFMGAGVLAGGAVGVAMAPVVGGVLSSAVLGAAGIGGVVGGAVLAARDERVKTAWQELGAGLLNELKPAQDAFAGPMVDAARMIGREVRESGLVDTLSKAAALVDPLARGLTGFVTELGPGLDSAFAGGRSNMEMLGDELPDLGRAISDMLDSMAKSGDESAVAMKDALDVTEDLIAGIGDLTAGLAQVYALTRNPLMEKVFDVVPVFGLIGAIGQMNQAITKVPAAEVRVELTALGKAGKIGFAQTEEAAKEAAKAIREFHKQIEDLFDIEMNLDRAQDKVVAGFAELDETLRENGRHWSVNTEAGRANRAALLDQVENLERLRRSEIGAGVNVHEANRRFNEQLQVLLGLAGRAGATKAVLDDLVGDYRINVTTVYQERGRPPRVIVGGDFQVFGGGRLLAGSERRQHGGPVFPGRSYSINEHLHGGRPVETFTPAVPGMVAPASLTPSASARPLVINASDPLSTAVFDWLRRELARRGGTLAALGLS